MEKEESMNQALQDRIDVLEDDLSYEDWALLSEQLAEKKRDNASDAEISLMVDWWEDRASGSARND